MTHFMEHIDSLNAALTGDSHAKHSESLALVAEDVIAIQKPSYPPKDLPKSTLRNPYSWLRKHPGAIRNIEL